MANKLYNYYRIEKAITFLTENFKEQPSLDTVAKSVNMSAFHFQRVFTDWVGISPKKFLQFITIDYLKAKIQEAENMMDAADMAGLSSSSRVHDLFINMEGVTPQQYKSSGRGLSISYGYHPSPFGMCFIAVANEKVCGLKFIDEEKTRNEFEYFSQQWHFANLIHRPDYTQKFVNLIFHSKKKYKEQIQLLVQGTDFQIKVWEALVNIPFGTVNSFQQIAQKIGHPNSARAVGSAVGQNTILYLIPCHRVISQNGTMGNYHFGKVRKQLMIGYEINKASQTLNGT